MVLATLSGCGGERSLFGPEPTPGGGGAVLHDPALVGTWEVVLLIQVPSDIQIWTTRWTFRGEGTCDFRRTIRSVVEGTDRVTARTCTWSTSGLTLRIRWNDGTEADLAYSFAALNPARLVIDGAEYTRIS